MYFNVNKVVKDLRKEWNGNSYIYTKISNLMSGIKGNSTKKEIQHLRRILRKDWQEIDGILEKLENS